MSKIAFVFPGQGSQAAGMGKAVADAYPEARKVFETADRALGIELSRMCFEGPESDLQLTENTQPAILATSVAIHRVLASRGLEPDCVAGHSLGEYSALVAAGALQLEEALAGGADAVLLDNMPLDRLRAAVSRASGLVTLEASGGVDATTARAVAETGVDLISCGALTHSAPALDVSMALEAAPDDQHRADSSATRARSRAL